MSSRISHPSTRPRPHPSGQKAWSVDATDPKELSSSSDLRASIVHRIEQSSCGPLLGADTWSPSLLAVDPKSQELFVAETGLPRVKVFDRNGKYLRGFAVSGGVECMCVIPGEAIVVTVTEDIKVSKFLGLKSDQHRVVHATIKPFLDFKPEFEFNVKPRYLVNKKQLKPRFSMTYDAVGSRLLVTDSSSPSVRAFSPTNGSLLWEKPKQIQSKKDKQKDKQTPSLLTPLGIATDDQQSLYVCDQDGENPAVKVFDKNVQLMYLLGEGRGAGDKNMIKPCAISYCSEKSLLLVADSQRNCISAYSSSSAGLASMSWQFTLLIHGEPLRRQACVSASTPTAEGPSSISLADDGCLWVAYPNIATVFKAKWSQG